MALAWLLLLLALLGHASYSAQAAQRFRTGGRALSSHTSSSFNGCWTCISAYMNPASRLGLEVTCSAVARRINALEGSGDSGVTFECDPVEGDTGIDPRPLVRVCAFQPQPFSWAARAFDSSPETSAPEVLAILEVLGYDSCFDPNTIQHQLRVYAGGSRQLRCGHGKYSVPLHSPPGCSAKPPAPLTADSTVQHPYPPPRAPTQPPPAGLMSFHFTSPNSDQLDCNALLWAVGQVLESLLQVVPGHVPPIPSYEGCDGGASATVNVMVWDQTSEQAAMNALLSHVDLLLHHTQLPCGSSVTVTGLVSDPVNLGCSNVPALCCAGTTTGPHPVLLPTAGASSTATDSGAGVEQQGGSGSGAQRLVSAPLGSDSQGGEGSTDGGSLATNAILAVALGSVLGVAVLAAAAAAAVILVRRRRQQAAVGRDLLALDAKGEPVHMSPNLMLVLHDEKEDSETGPPGLKSGACLGDLKSEACPPGLKTPGCLSLGACLCNPASACLGLQAPPVDAHVEVTPNPEARSDVGESERAQMLVPWRSLTQLQEPPRHPLTLALLSEQSDARSTSSFTSVSDVDALHFGPHFPAILSQQAAEGGAPGAGHRQG